MPKNSSDEPPVRVMKDATVMSQATADALLESVDRLSASAQMLAERLTVSEEQAKRTRLLSVGGVVLLLVVGLVGYLGITGNAADAKQTCENSNDSRASSLALWNTVLGYVQAGAGVDSLTQLNKLQVWIAVLYQPHDCDDLGKTYVIPPPPVLTTP